MSKKHSFRCAWRIRLLIVEAGICLCTCIALLVGCNEKRVENSNVLTEDRIIETANGALRKAGVSLHVLEVRFDVDNREWQEALSYLKEHEPDLAREYDILEKYDYQSVHYIPDTQKALCMGEIFVFVDRTTGKVIDVPGEI